MLNKQKPRQMVLFLRYAGGIGHVGVLGTGLSSANEHRRESEQ